MVDGGSPARIALVAPVIHAACAFSVRMMENILCRRVASIPALLLALAAIADGLWAGEVPGG